MSFNHWTPDTHQSTEGLEVNVILKEVEAHLSRTRDTASSKDGIRYSLLKKMRSRLSHPDADLQLVQGVPLHAQFLEEGSDGPDLLEG